jgi:hypothetical protein
MPMPKRPPSSGTGSAARGDRLGPPTARAAVWSACGNRFGACDSLVCCACGNRLGACDSLVCCACGNRLGACDSLVCCACGNRFGACDSLVCCACGNRENDVSCPTYARQAIAQPTILCLFLQSQAALS